MKNLVLNFTFENVRFGLRQRSDGNVLVVKYNLGTPKYQVIGTYQTSLGQEFLVCEIACDLFETIEGETEDQSDQCFDVARKLVPALL